MPARRSSSVPLVAAIGRILASSARSRSATCESTRPSTSHSATMRSPSSTAPPSRWRSPGSGRKPVFMGPIALLVALIGFALYAEGEGQHHRGGAGDHPAGDGRPLADGLPGGLSRPAGRRRRISSPFATTGGAVALDRRHRRCARSCSGPRTSAGRSVFIVIRRGCTSTSANTSSFATTSKSTPSCLGTPFTNTWKGRWAWAGRGTREPFMGGARGLGDARRERVS